MSNDVEHFDSFIGQSTKIFGRMDIHASIRIDGKVQGDLETPPHSNITIAIGKSGDISGDIKAHRVLIAGKVHGNIYAAEHVDLAKTAQVKGDISFRSIRVEHGAHVEGHLIKKPTK
jgi:cytoskeletal protein CcmA (bactofilin family)